MKSIFNSKRYKLYPCFTFELPVIAQKWEQPLFGTKCRSKKPVVQQSIIKHSFAFRAGQSVNAF